MLLHFRDVPRPPNIVLILICVDENNRSPTRHEYSTDKVDESHEVMSHEDYHEVENSQSYSQQIVAYL